MADQHNANVPAVGNQISNDIPDIKENLEFHKDALERIFETWSDTDNSAAVIDTAVGFSDGTYSYDFPTNSIAANSVIMLGTSDTIVWMYLNAAPPGWKALSTGADRVLAVAGGSDSYNVAGGNTAGTSWASLKAHVHGMNSHTHSFSDTSSTASAEFDGVGPGSTLTGAHSHTVSGTTGAASGNTAAQSTSDVRPAATVGKLFQLDTA